MLSLLWTAFCIMRRKKMFKKVFVTIGLAFVFFLSGCNVEREVVLIDPFFDEIQVLKTTDSKMEIRIEFKEGYQLEGLYYDEDLTDLYLEMDEYGFINAALQELTSKHLFSDSSKEILYLALDGYIGTVASPRREQATYYLKWEPKEYSVYELVESDAEFTDVINYENTLYAYNQKNVFRHEVFQDFNVREEESYFSLMDIDLGLTETEEIVTLYPHKDGFYIYTSKHDVLYVSFLDEETYVDRLTLPFEEEELVKIEADYRLVLFLTTSGELYAIGDENYTGLFGFTDDLSNEEVQLIDLKGNPMIEDVYLTSIYVLIKDNMGRLFLNGKSSFVGEESEDSLNISYMEELDTSMIDEDIEDILLGGSGYGIMVRTSSGELYAMGYNLNQFIVEEDIDYVRSFQNVTNKVYGNLSSYYFDWTQLFYLEGDTLYDLEGTILYQMDERYGELEELIIDSDFILALYEDNLVDIVRVRSSKRMMEEDLPMYEDGLLDLFVHYYQVNGLDYLIAEEHVYFYQVEAPLKEGLYEDKAYTIEAPREYIVTEDTFFYRKEE